MLTLIRRWWTRHQERKALKRPFEFVKVDRRWSYQDRFRSSAH